MLVDENLEARQPFKLYRFGKNRKFSGIKTENFRLRMKNNVVVSGNHFTLRF